MKDSDLLMGFIIGAGAITLALFMIPKPARAQKLPTNSDEDPYPPERRPPLSGYTLVRCEEYRGHELCIWSYAKEAGIGGLAYDVTSPSINGGAPMVPRGSGKTLPSLDWAVDYGREQINVLEDAFG